MAEIEVIKDKNTLRSALNENAEVMVEVHQANNDRFDEMELSSVNDLDELQRKSTLLRRKNKILEKTTVRVWNSWVHLIGICSILSISSMQIGYSLCEITTVWNQRELILTYQFSLPIGLALGMMVSFMPLGATVGSFFARLIIKCLRKKIAFLINNSICILSSFVLMQINLPATILLGRFLYGWTIACHSIWMPLFIRQILPASLHNHVDSAFSVAKVFAIMIGYLIGLSCYLNGVANYYRLMFCIPGILATIQLVLMFFFIPHSPTELFTRHQYDQGREVLAVIYKPQFVDMMFDKYRLEAEVLALGKKDEEALSVIQSFPDSGKKVFRSILMGVHLNIYRHMQGMSTLIIYAGLILSQENTSIAPYTNFYLNVIYFFMTLIAVFVTQRFFGRRFLLIFSSFAFTVCNIMIMVGMLADIAILTLVWIVLLMATFGIAYSVISETYPAEILRPDQNIYVSLTSWPALIFCTILPPVFSDITSSRRPWPMFLIFAIYSLLSTIYLYFCAVESRGKRYIQIIQQF